MGMVLCASTTVATAAPYLGLVKTGTTTQTNDSFVVGTVLTYNLDVRFDSGGNPVSSLIYSFYTSPTNAVTFGSTPFTTLNSPFLLGDAVAIPVAGATLAYVSGETDWFKQSAGDYAAFTNNIATYQINTSTLAAGEYLFSFNHTGTEDEYVGWSTGSVNTSGFAASGTFVLEIIGVPEPGTWALMVVGGLVAGWKIRRRRNAR